MTFWEVVGYVVLAIVFSWVVIIPIAAILRHRGLFGAPDSGSRKLEEHARKLEELAKAHREEVAARLDRLSEELAEMSKRLASIEKVLKEVE